MTEHFSEKQKDLAGTSTPLTLSVQKEDEAVSDNSDISEYDRETQRLLDILAGKIKIESMYTEEEAWEIFNRT